MKLTLSLTPSDRPLDDTHVQRASPIILTGALPTDPVLDTWRADIWARPTDVSADGAETLATAYGTILGSVVTIAFTGSQLLLDLAADDGNYDSFWLVISGIATDGQRHICRRGWVTVEECGVDPSVTPAVPLAFSIENDTATFSFNGVDYTFPVVQEAEVPEGAVGGEAVVVDDLLIITINGVSFTVPVVPV